MNALLSRDHAEVDVLLDNALKKFETQDAESAFTALDFAWARLAVHIRAEHLHLFPGALEVSRREAVPDIDETLERLRRDHDFFMHEFGSAIKSMRSMTDETKGGIMRDAARALLAIRDRLIEHNAIEEERIYPLCALMSERDGDVISRFVSKELNNLPPRFSK